MSNHDNRLASNFAKIISLKYDIGTELGNTKNNFNIP